MNRYDPLKIEAKWQARWEKEKPFAADDSSKKPKMFLAEMFPYPSGASCLFCSAMAASASTSAL